MWRLPNIPKLLVKRQLPHCLYTLLHTVYTAQTLRLAQTFNLYFYLRIYHKPFIPILFRYQ